MPRHAPFLQAPLAHAAARLRVLLVDGLAGDPVVRVVDGLLDEPDQVPVAQGVNDVPPVFPRIHQPAEAELGEVLADDGAGHARPVREFGNGLRTLAKLPQQMQPGGLGEHPQGAGGRFQQFRTGRYSVDERGLVSGRG